MKMGFSHAIAVGLSLLVAAISVEANSARRSSPPAHQTAKAEPKPAAKPARKGANPGVGAVPEDISPETAEVVWLYHHGFDDGELLRYVNKSHADFKVSVNDVNYLKDIGISTEVVVAMIRPAEARENVARLRQRLPGWASYALFGQPEKAAEPSNQNAEPAAPVNEAPEDMSLPDYYGPSNHQRGYPLPPPLYPYGPYRGGPGTGYDDGYRVYPSYPGGQPLYDPYGGRTWYP